MKSRMTTAIIVSVGLASIGTASLAEEKHHGANASKDQAQSASPFVGQGGMQGMGNMGSMQGMGDMGSMPGMGGDHMQMMQSMMKMHAGMMQSMGGGERMKDRQIKALLENAKADVAAVLATHDASGDGALDVDEIAQWYAAVMRPKFVDGFQHLDADGSGDVSIEELEAAVERMSPAGAMPGMSGMSDMSGMNGADTDANDAEASDTE